MIAFVAVDFVSVEEHLVRKIETDALVRYPVSDTIDDIVLERGRKVQVHIQALDQDLANGPVAKISNESVLGDRNHLRGKVEFPACILICEKPPRLSSHAGLLVPLPEFAAVREYR